MVICLETDIDVAEMCNVALQPNSQRTQAVAMPQKRSSKSRKLVICVMLPEQKQENEAGSRNMQYLPLQPRSLRWSRPQNFQVPISFGALRPPASNKFWCDTSFG